MKNNSHRHQHILNNRDEDMPSTSTSRINEDEDQIITSSVDNDSNASGLDETEKRRNAYMLSSKIRDEHRKVEQGISSEPMIESLFMDLHQADDDDIGTMRTIKAEGQTLKQLIQLSSVHLDKLRNETAKSLETELFVTRIKNFAADLEGHKNKNPLIKLGKHYSNLMRSIPDFHYMRPCIELQKAPKLKGKRERRYVKREQQDVQVVKAKTMEQLRKEEENNNNSVSKELDNVYKQFRAFCRKESSNEVDYYKFVLHPRNFGETVENMFYVSFLIKDGQIGLRIDEQSGCPRIVKIPQAERLNVQRSEMDATQVIGRLDYSTWKRLVQKLEINEPFIKRSAVQ